MESQHQTAFPRMTPRKRTSSLIPDSDHLLLDPLIEKEELDDDDEEEVVEYLAKASYPWDSLARTSILWTSYLTSACTEGVRPPTILDIRSGWEPRGCRRCPDTL